MRTLRDWADYYLSKGVFSYPSNRNFNFKEWDNIDKAEATYKSLNWTGKYLSGVIGQKGKRAIKVNIEGMEDDKVYVFVKYVLNTLYDTEIYPWVIREINWLYIIVESDNVFGQGNVSYGDIILLWQGHFPLPAIADTVKFYFKGIPTIAPKHIQSNKLLESMGSIKSYYTSIHNSR